VNLAGRSVLLTGATGGLGHAIARRLHRAGASLVLSGRRADVLGPLAAEVGGRAAAADLSDPEAVARLAGQWADVDVLVSNAGLPASGPLGSFSVEQIDRALAVNLRAPMILTRVLAERMAARRAGHLVFISSLSGKVGSPGTAVYSATKFGLRGFAQGLRADVSGTGVGVSVVFPGFVRDAGMFAEAGGRVPPWVGTSAAGDVADAVVEAIERERGEVDVAPVGLRLGVKVAGLAPGLAGSVQNRFGGRRISEHLSRGQTGKR
jgi:uncharacterized protein